MICRQWTAMLKDGRVDDYLNHLRTETFPKLSALRGFVRASVSIGMEVSANNGRYVQVLTYWESLEAIKQFAGEDYSLAVVPTHAAEMMTSFDSGVSHSEVVLESP